MFIRVETVFEYLSSMFRVSFYFLFLGKGRKGKEIEKKEAKNGMKWAIIFLKGKELSVFCILEHVKRGWNSVRKLILCCGSTYFP
jgi:hypothetical protein